MSNALKNRLLPLSLVVLFCYTFSTTWHELFLMWTNYGRGYDHGFLLLAICLYLAHRIYQESKSTLVVDQSKIFPLFFLTVFNLTWLAAYLMSIAIVQEVLLPLILLAMVAAFYGYRQAKLFAFPILFIYLALPIWDELTVPSLQALTIAAVRFFIKLTGLTAHIYSNFVQIPWGTFEIANSCAGMRYMLIALTITVLQAYLSYSGFLARALFFLWGLFLSLLANWIRVYLIILIGYKTQMQSSIVGDHEMFGWLVFAITMAPLFLMTNYFARFDNTERKKQKSTIVSELTETPTHHPKAGNKISIATSIALILLLTKGFTFLPELYNNTIQLAPLPVEIGTWQQNQQALKWQPGFKNADRILEMPYSDGLNNISVHIYAYAKNSENAELVSNSNKIAIKPWGILEEDQLNLPKLGTVMKLLVSNKGEKRLVYAWYKINQYRETQTIKVKVYQLLGYFSGSTSGRFIAISISCAPSDGGCQQAQDKLDAFTTQLAAQYEDI